MPFTSSPALRAAGQARPPPRQPYTWPDSPQAPPACLDQLRWGWHRQGREAWPWWALEPGV